MPIRKGDGVSLAPKGFQEVRKGDGTVIYSAGGVTVIDDFEDGDIAEYSGDTADFNVQTTTIKKGAYALESSGLDSSIYSTAGLGAYPSQGDTFRCYIYPNQAGAGVGEIWFATTDSNNTYFAAMNNGTSNFQIGKRDAGSKTNFASQSYNWNSEWYEFEIEWLSDGTINATAYDSAGTQVASLSATDATFTGGGIGFLDFSAAYYWDHYRVI